MTEPTKPEFRGATHLLRGICAFSVLIWHYQHFFYIGSGAVDYDYRAQPFFEFLKVFYKYGFQAVPAFWCISGLIMTHSYINNLVFSIGDFVVARFSRLYPMHLIALGIVSVLQIFSQLKFGEYQIYGANNLYNFLLHLLFVQGWKFPYSGDAFNAQTWSVSVEIAVYWFFYLAIKSIRKRKMLGALIVLICCLIIREVPDLIISSLFFIDCLTYFAAGIVIYFAVEQIKLTSNVLQFSVNGLILFLVFLARYFGLLANPSRAWFLILTILVFIVAQFDESIFKMQLQKLRIVGDLSYSVFLWHIPIQVLVKIFAPDIFKNGQYANGKIFFLSYLTATYLVGYISFKMIETPIQDFLRRRYLKISRTGRARA